MNGPDGPTTWSTVALVVVYLIAFVASAWLALRLSRDNTKR